MQRKYSLDTCHFCKGKLSRSPTREYPSKRFCLDEECGEKYQYGIKYNPPKWAVSFIIDKYYFQIIYTPTSQETGIIEYYGDQKNWDNIYSCMSIPEVRLITLDNYLLEVNKAKNLQLFK